MPSFLKKKSEPYYTVSCRSILLGQNQKSVQVKLSFKIKLNKYVNQMSAVDALVKCGSTDLFDIRDSKCTKLELNKINYIVQVLCTGTSNSINPFCSCCPPNFLLFRSGDFITIVLVLFPQK